MRGIGAGAEMTEPSRLTDEQFASLRLEGLEHLVRMESGLASDADAAAFLEWKARSSDHGHAFHAAVELKRLAQVALAERDQRCSADNVLPFTMPARAAAVPAQRGTMSRRRVMTGALAASVAGALFLTGRSLDWIPGTATLRADYATAPGERRAIRLARGATLDLNTRSAIQLRAGLTLPAAELLEGEASLTTAAGVAAMVIAGLGRTVGRSGSVNIRRDGDDICVTCVAGEAEVSWGRLRRLLKANQEVHYDAAQIGAVLAVANGAARAAWRAGKLVFDQMPLRDVVAELNRYRRGKIYVADNALGQRRVSGIYGVDQIDSFISQAELGFGAKVLRLPGNVVILS